MQCPDVDQFDDLHSFLMEFILKNRGGKHAFSYALFSKKMHWPKSLLHELASGRKKMSVKRALEFSVFFHLKVESAERLLLLGVKKGVPEKYQALMDEMLKLNLNKSQQSSFSKGER